MGVLFAIGNFISWVFGRAVGLFSTLPGQIFVLVAGVTAVVLEVLSFIRAASDFISGYATEFGHVVHNIGTYLHQSSLYSTIAYMIAMDAVVEVLSSFAVFFIGAITFLFGTFMHLVFIFLGLRYGYKCYKYLLTILSNGMAKA